MSSRRRDEYHKRVDAVNKRLDKTYNAVAGEYFFYWVHDAERHRLNYHISGNFLMTFLSPARSTINNFFFSAMAERVEPVYNNLNIWSAANPEGRWQMSLPSNLVRRDRFVSETRRQIKLLKKALAKLHFLEIPYLLFYRPRDTLGPNHPRRIKPFISAYPRGLAVQMVQTEGWKALIDPHRRFNFEGGAQEPAPPHHPPHAPPPLAANAISAPPARNNEQQQDGMAEIIDNYDDDGGGGYNYMDDVDHEIGVEESSVDALFHAIVNSGIPVRVLYKDNEKLQVVMSDVVQSDDHRSSVKVVLVC